MAYCVCSSHFCGTVYIDRYFLVVA